MTFVSTESTYSYQQANTNRGGLLYSISGDANTVTFNGGIIDHSYSSGAGGTIFI